MTATPGGMLSHYRLIETIGQGGMGVVYRARDLKLNRDVALKVLAPDLMADTTRRRRFIREAQAAAAVTHTNIATVHEIDEADGVTFIVMELIEGETLRSRLRHGCPAIEETIDIAAGIAEGLARAHRAGVVHRDLKPENIMVSPDRQVKILDFGLAKLIEDRDAAVRSQLSQAATASAEVTRRGQILGTTHYMSPEQARGESADQRSDIFSFGITLYEMLTGRRPFHGRNPVETLAEILRTPAVPVSTLNPRVPPRLGQLLDHCLDKDPERRYQRADRLAADLKELRETTSTSGRVDLTPPGEKRWIQPALLVTVALVVTILLFAFGKRLDRPPGDTPPMAASVAFLSLDYEGPEEKAYLKNALPLMFAERMRASPGLRVAPFGYSRQYEPGGGLRAVTRDLAVNWVVEGRVAIRGESFELVASTLRGADGRKVWSRTLEGALPTLLHDADRLADGLVTALGAKPPDASSSGETRDAEAMDNYLRAQTLFEGWDVKKNYARAAEAASRAIELDPEFAEAHALLARALITRYLQSREPGLIQRALESAERAVALAPQLPEAHAALGVVQLQRGRSAEATQAYQEGLRLAPADDALTSGIAMAYAQLGRDEKAEEMYRRAIDMRPSYWAHYNALGVFYFLRGRLDDAKQQFREVIERRPESDTGYANLAAVHILAGEHTEAEPLLRAALNIDPAPQTRNNLGVVYYATGNFEQAAREWQALADTAPGTVTRLSNLGDAYRQLGRSGAAQSAYERAIELGEQQLEENPGDADARAMLSMALAGAGRCDLSTQQAARALEDDPRNPTLSYYAAVAGAICGDRDAAIPHAARAIEGGIKVDVLTNPDLRPLLDDPSIQALLK